MADMTLHDVALACRWEPVKEKTWSGTPWMLRSALSDLVPVEDIDVSPPRPLRIALKIAGMRRSNGSWKSLWAHSRAATTWSDHQMASKLRNATSRAVISIQDLGHASLPMFIVQDLSYGLLTATFGGRSIPHFRTLGQTRIEQLQNRQLGIWHEAEGLFPMSRWLANDMVQSGVSENKIVVVPPGVNVAVSLDVEVPDRRQAGPARLLFVGRDFDTKAGDQVVAAFIILREKHAAEIELTVIGPKEWPLADMPDGVHFMGPQPQDVVDLAMRTHDLFVMPSRFEGFGIVFAEALARGLPCIGRNAFAMPEIIDPVSGGRLIDTEEPEELALAIESALHDQQLYDSCRDLAPERRAFYSWSRAAKQMLEFMSSRVA